MANHTIKVTVESGSLKYEQITSLRKKKRLRVEGHQARVKTNDKIKWHCDVGDLAIIFKRDALDENVLSAAAGRDTKNAKITATYAGGGNNVYPYFVLVVTKPLGIPIYEDPDIIIDI